MNETDGWGVVILKDGRCWFASPVVSKHEALHLLDVLGGGILVDAFTLRMWKREMC